MNFLFWNVLQTERFDLVARLVAERKVDIIILSEASDRTPSMLLALNSTGSDYHFAATPSEAVTIFTSFPSRYLTPVFETDHLSIRELTLPGLEPILLAAVHLESKMYQTYASQILICAALGDDIREVERQAGHRRTVLVGDLNVNPFEEGVVGAKGLNSVQTRRRASRMARKVGNRTYPFFYNPMWRFFGDSREAPSGTYHYPDSQQVVHYWNMFDQVLVRPDLIDIFVSDTLEIITEVGGTVLVDDEYLPSHSIVSDHLPLYFQLNL